MSNNRLLIVGFLGLAYMLTGAKTAQAQSYFYGYYYPEEHRFSSAQLNSQVYDYSTITPMWNAMNDSRSGYSYPIVPTNTPLSAPRPMPTRSVEDLSTIRVIVPDGQAVVWFGGYQTKSTGTERVYQTPALKPGSYNYDVKIAYTQDGRQIAEVRTITVTPGQAAVVDFTSTFAASKAVARIAP